MRLQSNLFLILFTLNVYNIYVKRTPSVTYRLIRKLTCFAELRNEHTFFRFHCHKEQHKTVLSRICHRFWDTVFTPFKCTSVSFNAFVRGAFVSTRYLNDIRRDWGTPGDAGNLHATSRVKIPKYSATLSGFKSTAKLFVKRLEKDIVYELRLGFDECRVKIVELSSQIICWQVWSHSAWLRRTRRHHCPIHPHPQQQTSLSAVALASGHLPWLNNARTVICHLARYKTCRSRRIDTSC